MVQCKIVTHWPLTNSTAQRPPFDALAPINGRASHHLLAQLGSVAQNRVAYRSCRCLAATAANRRPVIGDWRALFHACVARLHDNVSDLAIAISTRLPRGHASLFPPTLRHLVDCPGHARGNTEDIASRSGRKCAPIIETSDAGRAQSIKQVLLAELRCYSSAGVLITRVCAHDYALAISWPNPDKLHSLGP